MSDTPYELIWLSEPPMKPYESKLGPFARFWDWFARGPMWPRLTLMLLAGGTCLVLKLLPSAPLGTGLMRDLIPAVGEALIVAAVLALAVDPGLKEHFHQSAIRNVFEHMIGFDHEPEIRAKLRSLALDTKLFVRNYDLRCVLEARPGGGVTLHVSKTVEVVNQSRENAHYPAGWQFTKADNPRDLPCHNIY